MSHIHFDPAQVAFHDDRISTPPPGAVPVTHQRHAELMAAQAAGKRIAPGAGGHPDALDPPAPSLEQARSAALARIGSLAREMAAPLVDGIPAAEMASWTVKEAAARAVIEGVAGADELAVIEAEAAVTGEAPSDLAQLIVERAATLRAAAAAIAGIRRKAAAAIAAAATPAAIQAALDQAQADADAFLASL